MTLVVVELMKNVINVVKVLFKDRRRRKQDE